ncbi:ankyrin [Gyrodon lividus]|nr:ankyrin [Gyrodon lividus]
MERGEREVLTGATNIGKKTGVTRTERKKQIDPKEVTEFLRWLDGLDCTGKHEDTLELRQAETCTWLPETERYRSWRRGDISFLWLEGKPGSGKSVLASSVIDELEHSQRGGEVLVFFYCDFRNERSTNPPEIMRSLISQLLRLANIDEIDCRDAVSELVERKSRGAAPPNDMKLLTRLVRSAAKLHDQPLIVIDALDECKDVEKLLNAVKGLNNGHIRLFVTSRPEQMIKETLSDLPSISLSEMTSAVLADMELHVTEELDSRRWLRVLELDLKEEIRSALLEAADGMFRWVQCQIDTLAQCTSAGEIRTALQNLPLGLDETYERMLVLIDRNKLQAALVRRALVWLVAALEPQRLPDIMEALKIDLDQRRLDDNIVPTNGTILLDACGSLVTYDSNSDIISLSHFSVKEYLTGELVCTKLPRYHIGWNDAHEELARVCMCYMSLELGHSWKSIYETLSSHPITRYGIPSDERESSSDKEESSDEEESSDPRPLSRTLLSYALSRGFEHLAHLGATHELVWDDMKVLRADIQRRRSKWKKIRYMFSTDRKFWSHSDPLAWSNSKHDFMFYVLVFFAPVLLLETFLDRGAPTPKDGTNPLLYAAHFNKIQHAKILLSRGASVKNVGWVVDGSRQALPVEVAVERRCKDDLVDLFLAEWVPQALLDDTLSRVKELPFRILRSLVRTDAFAEWASMCRHERLLLHEVLEQGCYFKDDKDILSDIARRLVQVGWDASACNSKGQTPLHIAIANHYVAIVEYLASIQVPLPPDILFAAARARRDPGPMMRLLIDNGADVHVLMSDGDSVLHAAMISHYEPECLETVKMLIDAGCDPCTYNSKGETPLHVATIMQHVAIVEYLISIHVPLPPDILLAAARAWNKQGQMMCMLVDNGADVYALTSDGDCVLHLAMGLDDEGRDTCPRRSS